MTNLRKDMRKKGKAKVESKIHHPISTKKDNSSAQIGYAFEKGVREVFKRQIQPEPEELHNYMTEKYKKKTKKTTYTYEIDAFYKIRSEINLRNMLKDMFEPLTPLRCIHLKSSQNIPIANFQYVLFEVKATGDLIKFFFFFG